MSFSSHFFRWTSAQARQYIQDTIKQKKICIVNFVYFAQAMKFKIYEDTSNIQLTTNNYKKALEHSDLLCIDGIAMQIFDRVWQFFFEGERRWTDNLNGTDFLPYILDHTKNKKVGIIMSTVYDPNINKWPEWMDKWLQKLQELYPHIDIIFKYQTLFSRRGEEFPFKDLHNILWKTQSEYDHILFLNGIGGPVQEIWTEQHKKDLSDHNLIILNNGATLDYYSGFETRAPKRVIKMRIGETLWRVITQPQKNLKKFLAMFSIVKYWRYLIKKVVKK
jgi:exopolysaccharide biosynthesis WecB/TagA/CpsF family protein